MRRELSAEIGPECECLGTDLSSLHESFGEEMSVSHPHLFSPTAVFVSPAHLSEIQALITAVESLVAHDAYRSVALARAPAIARLPQSTCGVMLAYDFHITVDGPRLIEINTNAGGAMLNVAAQRFQLACCPPVETYVREVLDPARTESAIVEMFRAEWRRARGDLPLQSIAIVDDDPARQYLAPEFTLFQRLFERHGISAVIADACSLEFRNDSLWYEGRRIDMVYNRLTDFYLRDTAHASLASAYVSGATVVTPHPRAHALFAHKENLVSLTDEHWLRTAGIPSELIAVLLRGIPRTLSVEGDASLWWPDRARWFFKPGDGFGSRATYRGDKITRKVFERIMLGRYVAQHVAPPGERHLTSESASHKFDLRVYTDGGRPYLVAARLYRGQTTNFRTPGGGFAQVYVVPDASTNRVG